MTALIRIAGALIAGLLLCLNPAHAAAPVPDANALMDWAEKAYAAYFPGHSATGFFAPYTYRFYPATGNYIGVAGSGVWLLGPVIGSSTTPRYLGELADFSCQVYAADCGDKQLTQLDADGTRREFIVYMPWKARSLVNPPVVFALHGTGGDGERFFQQSGWREKADEEGFIAVFPSALTHCFYEDSNGNGQFEASERQVTTKWAAGRLGNPGVRPLCSSDDLAQLTASQRALADHPLADDLAFFSRMAGLLTQASGPYKADAKRLYAAGFSNGAEMTGRLATDASTTFAAVAAAAGPGPTPATPAARPMSVAYTVGQLDSEFAPKLGYPAGLPMTGVLAFNTGFQNSIVTPFTTVLQLASNATHALATVAGVQISQFSYARSQAGAGNALSISVIADLDHSYPNGLNHPLRLADPLWDFFRVQQMNEPPR